MTQKTKTIKHKTAEVIVAEELGALDQTTQDAKNAILIVSLMVNAFVLIGWLTLQVTNIYDYQVAAFLFTR
jgi:hypothetical protein